MGNCAEQFLSVLSEVFGAGSSDNSCPRLLPKYGAHMLPYATVYLSDTELSIVTQAGLSL
jgi:hypothetical protein